MSLKTTIFVLFSLFVSILYAQHFPGGVPGCEVWYIADDTDLQNGIFTDHSSNNIHITSCEDTVDSALFNFNPSVYSEGLCLVYRSPLEHSLNRSLFIVTEPEDNQDTYPHVGTKFNDFVLPVLGQAYLDDSLSRNTFVIETQQGYASRMVSGFNQHQNAHVHFYSWNNYDVDKKFKSYGQVGETDFYIGRKTPHPDLAGGPEFSGLFPEYIAFDRDLTENERTRVGSYLALKYGITRWETEHYLNSKNKVFWDKENNDFFSNNIFGIGRDDISGLNQLQCESAHARDYLVAATYEIMETNAEVGGQYAIENNDFLVFGDTGEPGVTDPDKQHLQRLNRVWLAQAVGHSIRDVPIHFRLDLNNEFQPFINDLQAGDLVLWMLHDPYVNNSYVSDFDNGNVSYYKPVQLDFLPGGEAYAHFKGDGDPETAEGVFFDRDNSFFDQYTFAVGPEVIVQFRPSYDCAEATEGPIECYELDIIITEGELEGDPQLYNEEEEPIEVWFNDEQTAITGEITYTASICAPMTYTAIVNAGGDTFDYEYEAGIIGPYNVDLGPSPQYLSGTQPTILLDAGQGMNDPEATYQWFFNEEQIYHFGPTLTADQPGEYCVVVTTGDQVCEYTDCVTVLTKLEAEISCQTAWCELSGNEIHITISEGAPPYTITVGDGNGSPINYVENDNNIVLEVPFQGQLSISIVDDLEAEYHGSCYMEPLSGLSVSMGPDLELNSTTPQHTLDTSGVTSGWGSYTYQYEWLYDDGINGQVLLSDTTPQLTVTKPGEYTAQIYIEELGCTGYASQTVTSVLEGAIVQSSDCDVLSNTIDIFIDFGFYPYTTVIDGVEYPGGAAYTNTIYHSGNISISSIPYGIYDITVTDKYGSTIQELDMEFTGLLLDIHDQLVDICQNQCGGDCTEFENYCNTDLTLIAPDSNCGDFSFDASSLIAGGQNVLYDWEINGISLNHNDPSLTFEYDNICASDYYDFENYCDGLFVTVTATDTETGCSLSETIIMSLGWCPVLEDPFKSSGYTTTVYPNPGDSNVTFYYNILSEGQEAFSGTVELFSMTGALIYSDRVQGQSEYTLPYLLVASGAYIIRATTDDGTVAVDRVIIK